MQIVPFVKFHGAGNDFIMIDDREGYWEKEINEAWIAFACHRRFGIGADGMILLQKGTDGADFFMRYYNADGKTSSFCGNGGRCIVAFAKGLQVHDGKCKFLGSDGWHSGEVLEAGQIRISMADVHEIKEIDATSVFLDTGSPHHVILKDEIEDIDVVSEGRIIRNSAAYSPQGTNVNFIKRVNRGELDIRTYERGVEDETFACGTGVVAAAISGAVLLDKEVNQWEIHAKGGNLRVDFERIDEQTFRNISLTGPAEAVFSGELPL